MDSREPGESPPDALVGGRYRIEVELGRGASAIVYRAIDVRLQRAVALKRMREDAWDPRLERRFLDEARTLAALRHPNLLEVYDADHDGKPYVASRLLNGETLSAAAGNVPIDAETALSWCLPILGALAVAHDHGIVHRDVKPSNIVLERTSDGRRVPTLLDFGIARRADLRNEETTSGVALGTPAYMAPEVICGEAPSAASDVWSMGVVLYRLLSAHHPFDTTGSLAMLAAVVKGSPTPLSERAPEVPRSLALAVDRALRPVSSRYSDARSFAQALLEAALAAGVTLPDAPDPQGLPEWAHWLASAASNESTARTDIESSRAAAPASEVTGDLGASSAAPEARATAASPNVERWRVLGVAAVVAVATAAAAWATIDGDSDAPLDSPARAHHRTSEPIAPPVASPGVASTRTLAVERGSEQPAAARAPADELRTEQASGSPSSSRVEGPSTSPGSRSHRSSARENASEEAGPSLPAIVRSWDL